MQLKYSGVVGRPDRGEAGQMAMEQQLVKANVFLVNFRMQACRSIHPGQHVINLFPGNDTGIMRTPNLASQFRHVGLLVNDQLFATSLLTSIAPEPLGQGHR